MKVIYIDLESEEKIALAVAEAVDFLRAGKIIVYPTDTIYGLGCDAMNEKAVENVFAIKGREKNKPFSVIVKDIDSIKNIAFCDKRTLAAAEKLLPGPYTLVYPGPKNVSKLVTAGKNSIGVRIPDNQICLEMARALSRPIITTSVNLSGEDSLSDPFAIVEYFKNKPLAPDLILDCGKIKDAQASMVIDLSRRNPQILRSGTRSLGEIMAVLEKLKDL